MYSDKKLPKNWKRYVLSIIVNNEPGVLTRISSVFFKRNFNIDSLNVCAATEQKMSPITISFCGDAHVYEQMVKQLHKLIDVIKISDMSPDESLQRDLALIRVTTPNPEKQKQLLNFCQTYKANPIHITPMDVSIEISGTPDHIDNFIELVEPLGIRDISRTGTTAIGIYGKHNGKRKSV